MSSPKALPCGTALWVEDHDLCPHGAKRMLPGISMTLYAPPILRTGNFAVAVERPAGLLSMRPDAARGHGRTVLTAALKSLERLAEAPRSQQDPLRAHSADRRRPERRLDHSLRSASVGFRLAARRTGTTTATAIVASKTQSVSKIG